MEEYAQPLPRIQTQGSRFWERGFRCTLGVKTTASFSLAFTYLLNFLFFFPTLSLLASWKAAITYLEVIFHLELPEDFVEWESFCVDRERLSSSNRYLCCTAKLEQESRSRIFMVIGSDSVRRENRIQTCFTLLWFKAGTSWCKALGIPR